MSLKKIFSTLLLAIVLPLSVFAESYFIKQPSSLKDFKQQYETITWKNNDNLKLILLPDNPSLNLDIINTILNSGLPIDESFTNTYDLKNSVTVANFKNEEIIINITYKKKKLKLAPFSGIYPNYKIKEILPDIEKQANLKAGYGEITNNEVEFQRNQNSLKGYGNITNTEVFAQQVENSKNNLGCITNAEVEKQRNTNAAKGYGSFTDAELETQREENQKNYLGRYTNSELTKQRELNKSNGLGDYTDDQLIQLERNEKKGLGRVLDIDLFEERESNRIKGLGFYTTKEINQQKKENKSLGFGEVADTYFDDTFKAILGPDVSIIDDDVKYQLKQRIIKYKENLNKAKSYESKKNWIYALSYYWDAMSYVPAPYAKEAYDRFKEIEISIRSGKPGLYKSDNQSSYDNDWKVLLDNYKQYFKQTCPLDLRIYKIRFKDYNNYSGKADYAFDTSSAKTIKSEYLNKIIYEGYENYYPYDWYDYYKSISEEKVTYTVEADIILNGDTYHKTFYLEPLNKYNGVVLLEVKAGKNKLYLHPNTVFKIRSIKDSNGYQFNSDTIIYVDDNRNSEYCFEQNRFPLVFINRNEDYSINLNNTEYESFIKENLITQNLGILGDRFWEPYYVQEYDHNGQNHYKYLMADTLDYFCYMTGSYGIDYGVNTKLSDILEPDTTGFICTNDGYKIVYPTNWINKPDKIETKTYTMPIFKPKTNIDSNDMYEVYLNQAREYGVKGKYILALDAYQDALMYKKDCYNATEAFTEFVQLSRCLVNDISGGKNSSFEKAYESWKEIINQYKDYNKILKNYYTAHDMDVCYSLNRDDDSYHYYGYNVSLERNTKHDIIYCILYSGYNRFINGLDYPSLDDFKIISPEIRVEVQDLDGNVLLSSDQIGHNTSVRNKRVNENIISNMKNKTYKVVITEVLYGKEKLKFESFEPIEKYKDKDNQMTDYFANWNYILSHYIYENLGV